jgi:glycine/D-amino acid oxidase-like deaminating enzyme
MSRIAVIGAGITGAFTSYMLAKHGYDVMVFDGKGMSCDATACNPGGINPLHGPGYPHVMASFYLHAYHEHLEHRDEIQKLSGIDYDLRVIDRIFLAFDEEEKKGLKKIEADYNRLEGFKAQWMSRDELKEIEPRISSKAVGGLFTTGNMSVDAQQYRTALCRAAEKLGAKFIDQDVLEIQCDHEQATHVRTEEMMYEVESLFLCSGYKTGEFLDALGLSLPVSPVKGEMLHVRFDTPFPCDITHGLTGLYHGHL